MARGTKASALAVEAHAPSEGPFHDPSASQDSEAAGLVGAFDDREGELGAEATPTMEVQDGWIRSQQVQPAQSTCSFCRARTFQPDTPFNDWKMPPQKSVDKIKPRKASSDCRRPPSGEAARGAGSSVLIGKSAGAVPRPSPRPARFLASPRSRHGMRGRPRKISWRDAPHIAAHRRAGRRIPDRPDDRPYRWKRWDAASSADSSGRDPWTPACHRMEGPLDGAADSAGSGPVRSTGGPEPHRGNFLSGYLGAGGTGRGSLAMSSCRCFTAASSCASRPSKVARGRLSTTMSGSTP